MEYLKVVKIIEPESGRAVARDQGPGGTGGYCLVGTELQFCKVKRVLEADGGDGSTL